MPDIQPDFSAPGSSALVQIASWALGLALIIAFLALIVLFVTIAFKGFGNQNVQQFASSRIGWVAAGVICLAGVSGIFQFLVGFDLGLS